MAIATIIAVYPFKIQVSRTTPITVLLGDKFDIPGGQKLVLLMEVDMAGSDSEGRPVVALYEANPRVLDSITTVGTATDVNARFEHDLSSTTGSYTVQVGIAANLDASSTPGELRGRLTAILYANKVDVGERDLEIPPGLTSNPTLFYLGRIPSTGLSKLRAALYGSGFTANTVKWELYVRGVNDPASPANAFGGLTAGSPADPNWGLPGLPDVDPKGDELIPRNMHPLYPRPTNLPQDGPRVSKWHDLQFVCLLIQDVLRRFPNVRRIWLAGFSKGCSMVMACYAFNNMGRRPEMPWAWPLSLVRGYYLGDFGVTQMGTSPNVGGYGWSILDGIDWGWVLTNSSPTRRAGDPGQASGVVTPMDPIRRPVLFRHGSEKWDGLPHLQGMVKTWAESAADLRRLHRCPRWNDGLVGTERGTGWYRYDLPTFTRVCVTAGTLHYGDSLSEEYPGYTDADRGKVRARYALRDARFPKWPAPSSQHRATAPLGQIEVINADHGNFILMGNPPTNCPVPYWDEVRLATDFFRDNGLGT